MNNEIRSDLPTDSTPGIPAANWEQTIIRNFAYEALREQRRARRWSVFFRCLIFAYLFGVLLVSWPNLNFGGAFGKSKITALVDVQGVIAHGMPASAENVITGLRDAFEHKATAAVIVRLNSPGGSPVQAGYINDEIFRLKAKYPRIKVYAVIEDICASGGYYIAAAADEIYADKGSIVGSIGVRMDSFGFVEALHKLGIERRLLTAGEHKGFLDPFMPLDDHEVAHVTGLLKEIHQQFINTVRKGRRDRLKEIPELYSGLVWTGEKGLELGLVDALGSAGYVAREIVHAPDIVDFTPEQNVVESLARRFGAQLSAGIKSAFMGSW